MAPITTPAPIKMAVLTTIASIASSIYETSSVYFLNDTEAYTTVDIN
jgi:hypothetical protein